jgi:hypothetical protein
MGKPVDIFFKTVVFFHDVLLQRINDTIWRGKLKRKADIADPGIL